MNRPSTESIVKESLFKFMQKNLPTEQISSIDEIVLNYVVSILEDLAEENSGEVEDAFDAEGFCEMMAAYVPEFAQIRMPQVCSWMFELEASLRKVKEDGRNQQERDLADLLRPLTLADETIMLKTNRKHQISETSDGSSYGSDSSGDYTSTEENTDVATLMETFPTVCEQEVLQCLAIAKGDLTKAAQLIFDRQEMGESLPTTSVLQVNNQHHKFVVDDQELKNRIIQRYSFVDKDDDVREHRPVAPKSEPKKLVRYRDSKIVSMKGERYTEVKKDDEEEKKSGSAGQKAARQNRFH
ncbi:CUE domain-containing protein 2-like [Macrosteles quadrilineatus]|uniref:CUE domain-containing protein 2-like n=1 Tax=Macrosteles quadrilineatus TaxID=74068 RepID=UPI0023E1C7B4|nr:CUE domain-containing protein 2-like [Macrosteles quadrilineatus]XP_054280599.1 CUE domain-containing protein 2-like [Macrosteles quadrilineatus]